MTSSSSAIYKVVHLGGITVRELEISDAAMADALTHNIPEVQQEICAAFYERYVKDTGFDPGRVEFRYLLFTKPEEDPAPAQEGTS